MLAAHSLLSTIMSVATLLLIYWVFSRRQRKLDEFVAKGKAVDRALIDEQLAEINRESKRVSYFSSRASGLMICGRLVTVNNGMSGSISIPGASGGFRTSRMLFTIVPVQDLKWFENQPAAFGLVFSGTRYAVLKINPKRIEGDETRAKW